MKKVIGLCLALCILLSICGCKTSNATYTSEIEEIIYVIEENEEISSNEATSNSSQTISNPTVTNTNVNDESSNMDESSNVDNSPVIIESENIICISPENTSTVSLLNEDMTSYACQKYTPAKVDEYFTGEDNYAPKSVRLNWSVNGAQPQNYQIEVSLNSDMSQSVKYSSNQPELTLYNLLAGKTYYWRVLFSSVTETLGSKVFTFSTQNHLPRTIYAEGVSNTRDIGGWTTVDGKRVKQGMIYRGAKLNDITSNGIKTMVDELCIKMDLDLRNSSETGGKYISPLGINVSYCNVSFPYYALGSSTSINDPSNYEAIANVMKIIAEPENYPIYIHCSIGRDRTGTVVSLINGLLGVREEDLARDYEISYFAGCFGENPIPMSDMLPKFLTIPDYIKTYYGKNYPESVQNFLLSIGVSKDEINSIRSIMLE